MVMVITMTTAAAAVQLLVALHVVSSAVGRGKPTAEFIY